MDMESRAVQLGELNAGRAVVARPRTWIASVAYALHHCLFPAAKRSQGYNEA
jgi:hypothetical protein